MTIWSQSYARRALLGEESQNPSMAAKFLLARGITRMRAQRAIRKASRFRRPFFRGNPVPALVVAGASKLGFLKGLAGRFRAPSDKRAAKVAGPMVASAVQGNLTAAKAIEERTTVAGIAKERAVWRQALAQVPPKIMALVRKYSELIPGVDHSSPEAAAETALSRVVNAADLEAEEEAEQEEVRGRRAAATRETAAARERREVRLTSLASSVGQALVRGRSQSRPRRKRRRTSSRPRSISF